MLDIVPKSFWSFPTNSLLTDDDFFTSSATGSDLSVSEDDHNVFIEANMPGLESDDIEVTYHKGQLWLRGSKKEEEKDKKKKYYRYASSSFSYRLSVPGNIDEKSEPDAEYKNGVMKVTFKKLSEEQPKKITVKKS
ncbi:TPA: Hsp20/alpha crystallin family protein [Candidatus Collierbacteria bacterium]|uniref:SHSP domain-containing protein n=1 Tax=Candidatus Collierbacteria bacterium GW2011_GWA2_42_17 TaxID=1618378 RepID=A0A0G1B979_9BACT|nr:MAG: hypothetical protein UU94_C0002G0023 [Candidatus Collierbacteria bacterium GW2011_GWB2_42_12]KKS42881.1 MAG: hypothetical protein UV06_C0004G0016 [Candidatus Collierbacteria bacterium GW2011_GWA2_42_17]KKS62991.1 MAG: hypothetical protein UV28_C0002G0014 [Candidatus Collierbacteria bacterium GW2011_GWE2_42_48]KKS63271.1 MAG: hypothetical protein UV29_C0004G0028 [Candidatus Collierbacteria bacterium GW2011_GWD2_42_50]KKS63313.1 MAG: hypothetical protein UV30_C0004G0026 [Candidatus Collie